jgi:hypothetical protein
MLLAFVTSKPVVLSVFSFERADREAHRAGFGDREIKERESFFLQKLAGILRLKPAGALFNISYKGSLAFSQNISPLGSLYNIVNFAQG